MRTKPFLSVTLLLLVLISACQTPTETATPTKTSPPASATASKTKTPPPTATRKATTTPTSSPTSVATDDISPTPSQTFTPAPPPVLGKLYSRAIIISIDGLRPDAMMTAGIPNIANLVTGHGTFMLTAQTIIPSSTLPSHASMLTGLCPEKHGVYWNDYEPVQGIADGVDLFDLAHAAGMDTAMFVGKEKMQQLTDPTNIDDFVYNSMGDTEVIEQLIQEFPSNFELLFVHLPSTDRVGHEYGWLSPEQMSAIREADRMIGQLLEMLDQKGLRFGTLIIITSDHGGHDTTHGSLRPEDMTIPWIIVGDSVIKTRIATQVYTVDTAATVAFALGLPIPPEWDGVPVYEAFGFPVTRPPITCDGQE